ncbi:helix-turn-helix domain-containing protein [Niveibacterium umoris]|uniref:Cytoskeleton protein RodZ n=1 Tax=Niveibacterium umoris TaxID=1193620 RepID=A0A840BHN6_9RHOO|nr:RodZ domain-containing protein [Niveibacterium umoris]MBB4012480.1 cytoskeleton protein RodZ [Niveibacterium umoris]
MESHSYASAPGVAASGVALRHAREARGLGVAEVASTLKLTARQIEAIESEQFEVLPGSAFARGFVRNYARYLGLDPAPLLERMEQPAKVEDVRLSPESNAEGSVPTTPSGYRPPSPLPAVAFVGLIVALGIVGFAFGWFDRIRMPASEQAVAQSPVIANASEPAFPPHTEETAVVTAQVEPVAVASEPVAVQSSPATKPAPQVLAAVSAPAPSAQPSLAPASSAPVAEVAKAAPAAAVSAPAPVAPSAQRGIALAFAQDAWVEVRDGSGSVVFSRLSKAGSTQSVQGTPPFALVIGNAPNVKLEYNGRPVDLVPYTKTSVARLSLK